LPVVIDVSEEHSASILRVGITPTLDLEAAGMHDTISQKTTVKTIAVVKTLNPIGVTMSNTKQQGEAEVILVVVVEVVVVVVVVFVVMRAAVVMIRILWSQICFNRSV
jgi:hypothetical protein